MLAHMILTTTDCARSEAVLWEMKFSCLLQESGGTVLSTNWKEVGGKKIECSPPTGMEKRAFEY